MSDEIEKIRLEADERYNVNRCECEWFAQTLDDVLDQLKASREWFEKRDKDPRLFMEEVEQVERRTKEACWTAIRPHINPTGRQHYHMKQAIYNCKAEETKS